MGFSTRGCVTCGGVTEGSKSLPSLGLCFLPHERMVRGSHPALPFADPLKAKEIVDIGAMSHRSCGTNMNFPLHDQNGRSESLHVS